MSKTVTRLLLFSTLALAALVAFTLLRPDEPAEPGRPAGLGAIAGDTGAFARVEGPQPLSFPADDGPHPDYLTEWWYYTGNLDTQDGRHFGFELTFFRRAIASPDQPMPARGSDWAADQLYLAHFALTDVGAGEFTFAERFSRGAAGLAGAQAEPYAVWLENWRVEILTDGTYRMFATHADRTLELTLTDLKGRTLHGVDGYSQKGPDPGNASIYISQTRLAAEGTVQIGAANYPVSGLAWMDHEYSTSALGPGEVGWDWFSIQLNDGSELMLFILRQEDGDIGAFSSGTIIRPDGSTRHLAREDFVITVRGTWESPHSAGVYPSDWLIEVPDEAIRLEVVPYLPDQELRVSFIYWEGAVEVSGTAAGTSVEGSGYVELTGSAHSMQGEF